MVYILNKKIPSKKPIKNALQELYGIGTKKASDIVGHLCINPKSRFSKLTPTQISKISKHITSVNFSSKVGSLLQKNVKENIQRYIKIRSYKGLRHRNSLPVRGQRTHTNAQTQKRKKTSLGVSPIGGPKGLRAGGKKATKKK